jgi:predicted Zn-dependent protease
LCASPNSTNLNEEDSARFTSLCAETELKCEAASDQLDKAKHAVNVIPTDYSLRINLGVIQMRLGKFDEAGATLARAIQLNPDEPVTRSFYAFSLNEIGHPEEAREQSEFGRLLDPEGWLSVRSRTALSICPLVVFDMKESVDSSKKQHSPSKGPRQPGASM